MYAVILSLVKHRAKECRFTKEHRSCCQAVFFAGASLHVFPARSDAVHPDQIVDRSPPAIQKHTHTEWKINKMLFSGAGGASCVVSVEN